MNSIDKNDVDISKLFEWGKEFTIKDRIGNNRLNVFIRLVGDAEINRARVYALRKSAELRKKLKTKDSDERLALIPDLDLVDKGTIVEAIVLFKIRELTQAAIEELPVNFPKEPDSKAGLEEQEQHQEKIDTFPDSRESEIKEFVNKRIDKERDRLKSLKEEELSREYELYLLNSLCEAEMVLRFKEQCVYFGSFKDSKFKKPLFSSFEQFDNLPREIKEQLLSFYEELELSGEDLKKSPEVTQ
jgi:hypothetical protein